MHRPLLAAGALVVAAQPAAQAAIVHLDPADITIPFNPDGLYLNLATAAIANSQPGTWTDAPWINFVFGGTAIFTDALVRPLVGSGRVLRLDFGDTIDAADTFAGSPFSSETHVGAAADQFTLQTSSYFGFAFRADTGVNPSQVNYGWMRVSFNNGPGALVHEWAYDDVAGAAITVGAIPEPAAFGTFAGIALFAFGALRRPRRG